MKDLILVTAARYLYDYTLELTFSYNLKAEIDFTDWIKKYPFFKPLENIDYKLSKWEARQLSQVTVIRHSDTWFERLKENLESKH